MADNNFYNVMWSPRDNIDPSKLAKTQKNSDSIYQYRLYNSRGILAKTKVTSDVAVPTSTNSLININSPALSFTVEKNRSIGFGLSAAFITETSTLNSTTNSKDAVPTIGLTIDSDTNMAGTGVNNAQAESPRTVNLWQARTNSSIYDGFGINFYYINNVLAKGTHSVQFWIRNSTSSPIVGGFSLKASGIFPIVMWVEDLGGLRQYG